tara:strand:+ start:137 stop:1027 length:891 start_codon:yes stop_codon:yes gene_type:complete
MNKGPIGFIGLGNMGGRIARRLCGAGFKILGYDNQAGRAEACGAFEARSISDVAKQSLIIFMSLPDSNVIEAVVEGKDGLLSHAQKGQTLVDLSTASVTSTKRLNNLCMELGVNYVDAGISGGAAAADKGTLTLMVGGVSDVVDELRKVFSPFSSKVVYMGPSGSGHTTKLLNNFLNAVSLSASSEIMIAGKKAGLDLKLLLEVINCSSGVNFATTNRFPHIIEGDYLEGGLTSKLMTKDIVLYVDLVRELGVVSLNSAGPMATFGLASALGLGDAISNRVVDAIGDLSGGVRLNS